jgi:hypothetical protein
MWGAMAVATMVEGSFPAGQGIIILMAFSGHSAEAGIAIAPKIIAKTAVINIRFFNIRSLQSFVVG